ncbi:hypothetical protein ACWFMI_05625 [Nocardiopsis terrae]
MRVTDVFDRAEEALWAQLAAEPVVRIDSGRRDGDLVVGVELGPVVDPREVLVLREADALVFVRDADRSVLCRVALEAPVGRPSLRRTPSGLTVVAPLVGPVPVVVRPGLRRTSRASRLRSALARFADRFRSLVAPAG